MDKTLRINWSVVFINTYVAKGWVHAIHMYIETALREFVGASQIKRTFINRLYFLNSHH